VKKRKCAHPKVREVRKENIENLLKGDALTKDWR